MLLGDTTAQFIAENDVAADTRYFIQAPHFNKKIAWKYQEVFTDAAAGGYCRCTYGGFVPSQLICALGLLLEFTFSIDQGNTSTTLLT